MKKHLTVLKTLVMMAIIGICLMILTTSCNNDGEAISRVLDADRNCQSETATIQYYKMTEISLKGCPQDFSSAYLKHINAWRRAVLFEQKLEQIGAEWNSPSTAIEAFIRGLVLDSGLLEEQRTVMNNLRNEAQSIDYEISTTYDDCLSIALKYDVDISKYK